MSRPELSGPSAPLAGSTPSTVKELVVKLELKLPPPFISGTVPVIVTSESASPPTAAVTPGCRATVASEAAPRVPYWELTRSLILIFVPAAVAPLRSDWICCRNPNEVDPPAVSFAGGWVTVTSVPTPYSACSTEAWEFFTPLEAAVTVITRPMPRARPSEMNTAWRMRRRSSRRRYVKNISTPLCVPGKDVPRKQGA